MDIDTNVSENAEYYEEKLPQLYRYSGLDVINTNLDYVYEIIKEKKIFKEETNVRLCCYRVNNKGKHPFLEFMLVKNEGESELSLPFTVLQDILYKEELTAECDDVLHSLLVCYQDKIDAFIVDRFETIQRDRTFDHVFFSDFNYQGCFLNEEENELYLFYDLTPFNIDQYDIYKESSVWFGLADEIINHRHICNIPIDSIVSEFFANNNDLLLLYDGDGKYHESPIVAYTGTYNKNLYFTYVFGERANKEEDITRSNAYMGQYFYFTNFTNAVHQGGWVTSAYDNNLGLSNFSKEEYIHMMQERYKDIVAVYDNGKYGQGGIVRFALFLGNCLVKMNYPEDKIDESQKKKERLLKEEQIRSNDEPHWEKLTERVTDYDGLWAQNNDSVFISLFELDNGELMNNVPVWVTKEHSQQVSLSYHYIDKKTLGENFDETFSKYSIL